MPRKQTTLLMETTDIPVSRTVGEIVAILVHSGASRISQSYDLQRELDGVEFTIVVGQFPDGYPWLCSYKLPSRHEAIYRMMKRKRDAARRRSARDGSDDKILEQAKRTAWRQLLRWVEAQMAMVQAGMADSGEVFMPYAITQRADGTTETMYEKALSSVGVRRLTAAVEGDE